MGHHTKDKGDLGVGFVIADLIRNDIKVALPISEHLPFDCIAISPEGELCSLSVKYREVRSGKVEVRLRSCWADSKCSHVKDHDKGAYDATAIYCPDVDGCYYVRNEEIVGNTIVLRIAPARNNQHAGVKQAGDYVDPNLMFKPR